MGLGHLVVLLLFGSVEGLLFDFLELLLVCCDCCGWCGAVEVATVILCGGAYSATPSRWCSEKSDLPWGASDLITQRATVLRTDRVEMNQSCAVRGWVSRIVMR